ncbi:MAG: ABC transporter permease [Azospirillaceae bacterium]
MGSPFTRRALGHASFLLGAGLTGVIVAMALVSLAWTPHDPEAISVTARLAPPGPGHWLGTDHFGRDILSMIMVGARNSLAVGAVAVGLGLAIGVPAGLLAASAGLYRRGALVDEAVGRATDLVFAFPALLTAVLLTATLGPGAVNAIIAIGIFNAAVFARVTRAAALQVHGREFVRAALALGRSRVDVTLRHVLPNILGAVIVQATIQFAIAILAEAALAYLGLGIRPPAPSWGKMLFDAQTWMFLSPMQAIVPGLAIALAVLGFNLLGDGLRDLLDPRLRVLRAG